MSWKHPLLRSRVRAAVGGVALLFSLSMAEAAVPDYKLGDLAAEDVITPVQLLVINPEATGALRQRVAEQVLFVVRYSPFGVSEAETELRQNVATSRVNFLKSLQRVLNGRVPSAADVEVRGVPFRVAMAEAARDADKDLPLEMLARLWIRGESDDAVVESLLKPVREAMAEPVAAIRTDSTFPANQSVRLMSVRTLSSPPTPQETEDPGQVIEPARIMSLWHARRLVETSFAAGQESMGRFAAAFVRPNAVPDLPLTEILRARKMEGVTVNDIYEPAQVLVRKGQMIDRKAVSALAVMREKSLIGALQTKLDQERTVAGQIMGQTTWMAALLGVVVVALILIFRRLRPRPSTALALRGNEPVEVWELGSPDESGEGSWRERALLAEGKAERAHTAIRTGVLGWMKEKIFQTMFRHRGELLAVQEKAEAEMRELELRLEQLHTPLQERISSYEKRIEELEQDLAVKGEENQQLIGARITVAKQQLLAARQRSEFGTN